MTISERDWNNYVQRLSKLDKRAGDAMAKYIAKYGTEDTDGLIDQAKQAYALRTQYKHAARAAMTDTETAKLLDKERPALTFEELLDRKMRFKGMTKDEAIKDILKTASKTNDNVNKEFGL